MKEMGLLFKLSQAVTVLGEQGAGRCGETDAASDSEEVRREHGGQQQPAKCTGPQEASRTLTALCCTDR